MSRSYGSVAHHAPPRPPPRVPSRTGELVWLGHASVLVELDGVRLVTDPVLRPRIGPLVRISAPAGPRDVGVVDGVLLSHLHADHADLRSLRALRRSGPIIAPRSARHWLMGRGLGQVTEAAVGVEVTVGVVTVTAVPAVHDGRRWPRGPAPTPIGFLIRGSRSIYFAGDTDLFDDMADLRGLVDVALIPIWGWGRGVGAGHLDPERAAQAVALIRPQVVIPIHWGTFALPKAIRSRAHPASPAREFERLVARQAPDVDVRVLTPGEASEL
jgi:L-ascorbate metabolism protein UlaG (beta-lactamase superfamily)